MRLFLAIELDEFIKNSISKLQHTLKSTGSAKIKYVETENIHLTLKFFGDVDNKKLEEIDEVINKTVKEFRPYILKVVNVGTFPRSNNPRVVWCGVKDKEKVTINLIKSLDNEFSNIGFKKEKSYQPHITLGRVKSIQERENLSSTLKQQKNKYFGKMSITSIKLKSSTLTPEGPIYKTIREYELGE